MTTATIFDEFLLKLKVTNAENISLRYGEVTRALNLQFRDNDSRDSNRLQVGSYGRYTAIKGVSDLDMLYIMPASKKNEYYNGGQLQLLKDAKQAIQNRYPSTNIFVDSPVVCVKYTDFDIELQPVFEIENGFEYPDVNSSSWKITKPRQEISAMKEANDTKNNNLRNLCRMTRAWKNKHGVAMGGLLIDTLAHNFLKSTDKYDYANTSHYDEMVKDFFYYLSNLNKDQVEYRALGSNQVVKVKKPFVRKAKKTYELVLKAINAKGQKNEFQKWRDIFGYYIPKIEYNIANESLSVYDSFAKTFNNTEEFIEDIYPVDIRYNLEIDCEVTQAGYRPSSLRNMLKQKLKLSVKKDLKFFILETDIPQPYQVKWKVLNRGVKAEEKNCIRGSVENDEGYQRKIERTDFEGEHLVECYIIKDNKVVARDFIEVPISKGFF